MSDVKAFSIIPFGSRLAILRAARRMSQAELADMIGIDQSLVSRYEKGLPPAQAHVEAVERALGIDLDAPLVEQAFCILAGTNGHTQPAAQ